MTAYLYQYTIGGIVFLIGLVYAARQGYLSFRGKSGLTLAVLIGGFLMFAGLQAYLQFAPMRTADPVPYQGTYTPKERLGTTLDYSIVVAYFLGILVVGTYFARHQKTTKDFFFAGQRFSWWLIAFSLIATTVGSYSFVKYSEAAYQYGLSSSMTYLNDWFWMPLLVFGWLPLLYFSRVTSVPEYFERRFGPSVRAWATVLLLLYLVGYVGVNLFTMGRALSTLVGWPVLTSAIVVAVISAIYVTAGGQTSVIMTDLFQGVMLLATGALILVFGINYFGGFDAFWTHLPRSYREAFANFNEKPSFNSVGVFWQDGLANTAVFYFLNQGIIMRFLSARSVNEARKAALFTPLVLMLLAAIATASGGWVARAMVHAGVLPPDLKASDAFFVTTELLSRPGVFGLVVATLIAALMSTVDTLITAIAAIVVNDIYKPHVRPAATEQQMLRVARFTSVGVALIGVISVPVFMQFRSVYEAHGAFTAAVTPPLVVTLFFSVFWKRYTRQAALWTLAGGLAAMILSGFFPELITPFAHGVPRGSAAADSGFFAGMRQHTYMRAAYGLAICGAIGVIVTLFTRPEPLAKMRGLVWGTVADALRHYKGSPGVEWASKRGSAIPRQVAAVADGASDGLPRVRISSALAEQLGGASAGDLLYISDARWWLGGLRSSHAIVADIAPSTDREPTVELPGDTYDRVVSPTRPSAPLVVDKLY